MELSATAVPLNLLTPAASAPKASDLSGLDDTAKRARIDKTAKDFEASFLSVMLGQIFEGVKTSTFGGGEGEEAFKSFLTDAMAKSITRHGGVGLSKSVSAEMLKMQGLSPLPATTAAVQTGAAA